MFIGFRKPGAKKPESSAYVAGVCFAGSFAMFVKLGQKFVDAGQISFAVQLALTIVVLIMAVMTRDKWTAEKSAQKEQQKFNEKLAEIELDLSLSKKQRDELSLEKELLLADLETAYVLKEQQPHTSEHQVAANDRSHVSNYLAILNQAAIKFWANADRDDRTTHPSKANVVAWLIERGLSEITARTLSQSTAMTTASLAKAFRWQDSPQSS